MDNSHNCPATGQIDFIHRTLGVHDEKLNKLVEIAANLSKIEERSVNQHDLIARMVERQDDIEERLEEIERTMAQMRGGSKAVQALGAGVIAVASALLTWFGTSPPPTGHN